jgi:sugar lactone lactonase YvrE
MENDAEADMKDKNEATKPGRISHRKLGEATISNSQVFPQGCQFSPDGLCVLTAESHELALYNTSLDEGIEWKAALRCPAGDVIRDYEFYPHMDSNDPLTCCFLGAAR